MDNNVPFPQANDFEKIILILNLEDEELLNDTESLMEILGEVTERQVSYYISATIFLKLVENINGVRKFTSNARAIRMLNSYLQIAELISILLMNPIFNKIYVNTMLFGKQDTDDIISVIKEHYPMYSDAIFERRAQTASSWINWIFSQIEAGK